MGAIVLAVSMGSVKVGILAPPNATVQAFLEAPRGDFNCLRLA